MTGTEMPQNYECQATSRRLCTLNLPWKQDTWLTPFLSAPYSYALPKQFHPEDEAGGHSSTGGGGRGVGCVWEPQPREESVPHRELPLPTLSI